MKKQNIIIITNKESSDSFPYSALSDIVLDFSDLGKSESWLQKQKFPIDLEKYRIDKKILRKSKYVKTNEKVLNK